MNLSPIALSTYARLSHLKQTIKALRANTIANESDLYIFSDAAKPGDEKKVDDVRRYIDSIDGFKNVYITNRKHNSRIKNNRQGISYLLDNFGKCIYLEEDIVTAPGFLTFMNEALEVYKGNDKIFSISGYAPPITIPDDYHSEYFILRRACAWGMGLWPESFGKIIYLNHAEVLKRLSVFKEVEKLTEYGEDLLKMVLLDASGEIDALDVKIFYHQYLNNEFTIYPKKSLVRNIGVDGSGVHCGSTNKFDIELWDKMTFRLNDDAELNDGIVASNYEFRRIGNPRKVNQKSDLSLKEARLMNDDKGKKLIFLISQPRAGSTMLQKILGGHSEIDTTSEPWIMLHPIFALKQEQLAAPFEPHLAEIALEDFVGKFPEKMDLFFSAVRRYAMTFYQRSMDKAEKPLFLDKTPRYYMIIPELARCFPEAKFVVLMRNPMAVLSSTLLTWFNNSPQKLLKSRNYNDLIDAPKMLSDGLAILKEKGYAVWYEKLVQHPQQEVKQLCRWLNIDFEPGMIQYGNNNIANGRLGDQIGVAAHDRPVTKCIDKWKLHFRDTDSIRFARKVFQSIGHATISRMGYDADEILKTLDTDSPPKEINGQKVTNKQVKLRQEDFGRYLSFRSHSKKIRSFRQISIVLPTKDNLNGLAETLESIPGAMCGVAYEILLYADREREEYEELKDKYPIAEIFYDHNVFENDEPFSWSKLMNHAFSHASGQWIMYGSDDIVFYPACFRMACELMFRLNDKQVGGITFFHRNTAETYDRYFHEFGYDTVNGDKPFINFGLIKAEAYRKTKGFDEKLRFFWADVDICIQILRCGYKIIPSPGSLVDHNNILEKRKMDQRVALFKKDMAYFHSKWRSDQMFQRNGPLEKVRYFLSRQDSLKIIEQLEKDRMEENLNNAAKKSRIVIDGVIFQLQHGKERGISRVWQNLIAELIKKMPNSEFIILQRDGYPIPIDGANMHRIPAYRLEDECGFDQDDDMLRQICHELEADFFLSTYYSRAPGVINVLMVHDLIPEKLQFDLSQPEWASKKRAIETADAFICVSHSTRNDLVNFYPQTAKRPMIVAYNGLADIFKQPSAGEVSRIRSKLELERPYVMMVGNRQGYKQGIRLLAALSELPEDEKPTVLCVGGEQPPSERELRLKEKIDVRFAGRLTDNDLIAAYGGAIALMVPSRTEGFGLPVIEAMACCCPVIAHRSQAVSEIGADAACFADLSSTSEIRRALDRIHTESERSALIQKGRDRAKIYNWLATSTAVTEFIDTLIVKPSILLTAIVSTYNAAYYIKGCLEDLEAQTISDRIEIIVVDSGSEQDEATVVRGFQRRWPNIKYIRTQDRESVYQAWNRGIKFAQGKYVSNANTDDRHRQDAFEQMVRVLEENEKIALVYADAIKTRNANETFRRCTPTGMFHWYDWDRNTLLEKGCFIGPQPVWRKAVHQEYGYFDERYEVSADFEFWLRISQTNAFQHIAKPLGLYMERPNSIEHANAFRKEQEDREILDRYRRASKKGERVGFPIEYNKHLKGNSRQMLQGRANTRAEESMRHKNSTKEAITQGGQNMHSPKTILKAVEHLVDGGQTASALWALDKLIEDFPEDAGLHNIAATLAYEQADTSKALAHFKKAVALDPRNPVFLKNLGDYYYVAEKDAENALAQYEELLRVDPNHIESIIMAGHLSLSLHRYSQGQQYYQRALDLDPQNMELRRILEKMGDPGLDQGAGAMSADDLYAAAEIKIREGDSPAAMALLEQLLAKDERYALAHNDLGVLLYESGNMKAAQVHYEKAAELQPENETFQKNLADFYLFVMGDHEKALKAYVQVLKLEPRDVEALLSCGQLCMGLGRTDDAREFFDIVMEIEPWNENGQHMMRQLDQLIESSKSNLTDLYRQAKAKASQGDLHGAIHDLIHYVAATPEDANAINDLGVLYFETGEKDKAVSSYEQAVRLEPKDHTYRKNLADFYLMEQGRVEEAMKLYLGVLEENPQDLESLVACGMISASMGQPDDAKIFYNRVIEIEPWNETVRKALNEIIAAPEENTDKGLDAAAAG